MNPSLLLVLAAAATVFLVSLRLIVMRVLERAGRTALADVPDAIRLTPLLMPLWSDGKRMEMLARPLLLLGFVDAGVFTAAELPGLKVRFLVNESDEIAAFVAESPDHRPWLELSVRYQDGTTTALSNRPSAGLDQPPFLRMTRVDPGTPAGDMYRRLLAERSPTGIKRPTRDTVVPDYELGYAKLILWQKNKGLTAEEVARVAATLAAQKRAR